MEQRSTTAGAPTRKRIGLGLAISRDFEILEDEIDFDFRDVIGLVLNVVIEPLVEIEPRVPSGGGAGRQSQGQQRGGKRPSSQDRGGGGVNRFMFMSCVPIR